MPKGIGDIAAFPVLPGAEAKPGMTFREYLAAAALNGLLAGAWAHPAQQGIAPNVAAQKALEYADVLLSLLAK